MYIYMYNSTSTEDHTCSVHMTILILSNICVHVYVHTCIYVLVLRVIHVVHRNVHV